MFFIVGLGNPGSKYDGTRHNVGFEVVETLARRHGFPGLRTFGNADVSKGRIGSANVLLVEPTTYMNLSGDAVGAVLRFYKGAVEDLLVIHDELDFEPGEVRVKQGGGHGGHNGLRSIVAHVGREFSRIRIGIGKPPSNGAEHVLSRFDRATREIIDEAVDNSADAVEAILDVGIKAAMNRINRRPKKTKEESDKPDVAASSDKDGD